MSLLPDDKSVRATVTFVDSKSNPAKVDGKPVWGTDREDLVNLTPDDSGFTCQIDPEGPLGVAQITCTADADLGEGVIEVKLLGSLEVIAGTAVGGKIEFSEPA